MVIGPALMKARAEAMAIADTNQPMGRGYNTAMAELLKEYKLDDMGETARAHILKMMENYADVEEWRAKQKDPADLNHPSRVWVKYQHSIKQADRRAAERAEKKPSMTEQTSTELARALERINELEAENEQQNERIKELDEERARDLRASRGAEDVAGGAGRDAVMLLMTLTNQADNWPPEVSPAKRKKAVKLARDVVNSLGELRKVATPKEKPAKGAD